MVIVAVAPFHFAYTVSLAVTVVVAVNTAPPPFGSVNQPPKVYPVFFGSAGREPTVVAGDSTILVAGDTGVVAA
jgi:hypothetical protein